MITVKNLSKSFGELKVLEDVSVDIEKGERIVIIGGSGCGKSVFLRSIERLEEPDKGQIFIGNDEITAPKADVNAIRQRMGMVYQGFHLFEHMNVIDNITLAPMHLHRQTREQAEIKAMELLKMVGLESRKYAMPGNLSGGQKQRIAIARCMAMEPEVMLFDEPTSALDPTMVGEVLATIRMLAKKDMTMIIVTHEMSFAREVGTRILYFDDKGIYEQGTPEEIFDHPQKPKTKAFIRKLKFFSEHIDSRSYDLMKLQGGILRFADKYGIGNKDSNRLQLCTEELIGIMFDGALADTEDIDMDISIEYSELDAEVVLRFKCNGSEYDPFAEESDVADNIAITILKRISKDTKFWFEDGMNNIWVRIMKHQK